MRLLGARCESCGRGHVATPVALARACPFCGASALLVREIPPSPQTTPAAAGASPTER
jgi:uncharacterized OB-fold protein